MRVFIQFMGTKENKTNIPHSSRSRQGIDHDCAGDPDSFCYVCAKFTLKEKNGKNITERIESFYKMGLGLEVIEKDKLNFWKPAI